MTDHSSISNSDNLIPTGDWLISWLILSLLWIGSISIFEIYIRAQGWQPSVVDSMNLWSKQRSRASELGDKAFILVGSSRLQLGFDMDSIKYSTPYEPVQLAIDGTSSIPVLVNLSNDPDINGVILFSVTENNIKTDFTSDTSSRWVDYYENNVTNKVYVEPYRKINNKIDEFFASNMVTRIDNAKPFTVILHITSVASSTGNYLITSKDRSRKADYNKVDMPSFYSARVARHLGMDNDINIYGRSDMFTVFNEKLRTITSENNLDFIYGQRILLEAINKIENRGGKVILIRMPTDKMIWEIDKLQYPRDKFWDLLTKNHFDSLHFQDFPLLSKYMLPDGSHLDYRDKHSFTVNLINIIDKNLFQITIDK